jgi:hypothetical protein
LFHKIGQHMEIKNWIFEFLQRRGIKVPDKRRLYAYRMNLGEYQALRDKLASAARRCQIAILAKNLFFCGAFVLYAAEWWRREYPGGAWQWDAILSSIEIKDIQFYQQTSVVVQGMGFWKLPLAGGRKAYFGSIVVQGGLPLSALKSGGGAALGQAMNKVLQDANRYRWSEAQIITAVEDVAKTPPKFAAPLQNSVFYALIAQMVSAVLRLKRECNLDGVADPIAKLDAQHPDWKNEFPLSLDDETTKHLLDKLVKTANEARALSRRALFSVERRLLFKDGHYELQSTIICPDKPVSGESLTAFAGIRNAPGYFVVDADVGGRSTLAHARSSLGEAEQRFTIRASVRYWSGKRACAAHKLVLHSNGQNLHPAPIPLSGGEALRFETPWVFATEDEGFALVSTGDARLSHSEVLLAAAKDWEIEAEGEISDAGALHLDAQTTIPLKRLTTGVARIKSAEDEWEIVVGVSHQASAHYELRGQQAPLQSNMPVFRGMPKVVYYDNDGESHEVLRKDIRLSRPGSSETFTGQTPSPGLLVLTIEQGGKRMGRLRFALIEGTSHEIWRSGDTPSEGDITLVGWGAFSLACKHGDVTIEEMDAGEGRRKLRLSVPDQPPAGVDVRCTWPGSARNLQLFLPFPATGGRAYDEHGKPLAAGGRFSLNRLLGKRIFVFDSNPNQPKSYALELQLEAQETLSHSLPRHVFPIALDKGRAEISLADYREKMEILLSLSDRLDAAVTVTLKAGRASVLALKVARYDTKLLIQDGCAALPDNFIAALPPDELAALDVLAVPLANPDKTQTLSQDMSESVPIGSWRIDHLSPGVPWLLVPPKHAPVSFRAAIVMLPGDEKIEGNRLCELAETMQHTDTEARKQAICATLERMVTDFNHSSWKFLERLWQTFQHLPLCSLDVFRLLARRSDLAVRLLFAPQALSELVRRLDDELGLRLEIAPISTWRKSVNTLRSYYQQLLGEHAGNAFRSILQNRFDELRTSFPNHVLFLDILQEEEAVTASQNNLDELRRQKPEVFTRALWRGGEALVQRYLLRIHAHDDKWPEPVVEDSKDLRAWIKPLVIRLEEDSRQKKILSRHLATLIWDNNDHKNIAANIPVICALWAVCDLDGTWWRNPAHLNALRLLRAFDRAWFDECYRQSLLSCFTLGLLNTQADAPDQTRRRVIKRNHP